jgi:actin-related protein
MPYFSNQSNSAMQLNDVLVTGGNTAIKGFTSRLNEYFHPNDSLPSSINIVESSTKKLSAPWFGGTVLVSQSTFNGWITHEEYDGK